MAPISQRYSTGATAPRYPEAKKAATGAAGSGGVMSALPLVIGISGASGVIYGIRLLEILRELAIPAHLVMSRSAEVTIAHETDLKVADVRALAAKTYAQADIG